MILLLINIYFPKMSYELKLLFIVYDITSAIIHIQLYQ